MRRGRRRRGRRREKKRGLVKITTFVIVEGRNRKDAVLKIPNLCPLVLMVNIS
jgi:hypothetical protein